MEMDDELENFIKEQRVKVAEDKANLKQEPPYMEMRAKDEKVNDPAKENIPPFKRSTAQGKEENQCPSLPLGEDYERKKQKLQQELRLDYRRYIARKKHIDAGEPGPPLGHGERGTVKEHLATHQPLVLLDGQRGPRPPSMRDAATLTEGRRGGPRCHRLGEGRGPWAEEDAPPPGESRTTRQGGVEPADGDSEGDYTEEELELMERRRLRQTGLEAGHPEKRRPRRYCKADVRFRDRRIEPCGDYIDTNHHGERQSYESRLQGAAGLWEGGTSRLTTNTYKAGFATGLMIGAEDAGEALQRRKDLYRQELQEQIAEQQRNRKREKDLELSVAATGANDPEKRPDRIKLFGLSGVGKRREGQRQAGRDLAPPGEHASGRPSDEKPSLDRERERLPPEQPGVAFQSPLLEYSSALGLGGGGLTPYSQALGGPRGMDTPRIPAFAPHPPPPLADAYRIPCYYGPSLPYLGQMAVIGGVPPMSYPVMPLTGGGLPSQLGPPSPNSHAHPPPPHLRPNSYAADVISGISIFPGEKVRSSKETYREALDQQIQEREERRRLEREESVRYEAKLEADMKNHEPWGRGGGGAPLRDSRGNLITDLKQMHKLNEEAYINPQTWQRRATANMAVLREDRPPSNNRVSGFTHVQTPQIARGSVFTSQPTAQELLEKDKYKTYLKHQIEEKRLKEAEQRENMRQEEEKEERKLEEQRAQILREYKEEQDMKIRKEMELKAKNEELNRLAEQHRREEERKKKEAEEKHNTALRRQYERERQTRLEEEHREASPPIPTLQRRGGGGGGGAAPQYTPRPPSGDSRRSTAPMSEHREASPPIPTLQRRGGGGGGDAAPQYTPRPPSGDSRHSTAPMSECSLSGLQSPPVPARRNQLRAAEEQRYVIGELAALWKKLRSEQRRVEGEWEEPDSRMSDRRREGVDVFDMARLCLPAPVRRPSWRNTEPSNLLHIHHSLQLRYPDSESRYGYSELPREEGQSVDIQSQADLREQQRRTARLRRKPDHDYFDLSPPRQPDQYERRAAGDPHTGFLLESESAFIDPLGDAYPAPPTPEQRTSQLSARERRRRTKRSEPHNMEGS